MTKTANSISDVRIAALRTAIETLHKYGFLGFKAGSGGATADLRVFVTGVDDSDSSSPSLWLSTLSPIGLIPGSVDHLEADIPIDLATYDLFMKGAPAI